MTLGEVLTQLEQYNNRSFILVPLGSILCPSTPAKLVVIPEDPGADLGVPGFDYFIEVYHAKDVLDTWRAWRNNRTPTAVEAIEAVVFFQENDAYLPTEEMKREGVG